MNLDVNIGDVVTVSDPGDQYADWNNEFRGTVRNVKRGSIIVESDNGNRIEVQPGDIAKKH